MDLQRLAGQLLWVGFDGPRADEGLLARVRAGHAGGAILFGRNVESPEQVLSLNRSLHESAPAGAPLLVCVDQEGGRVQRVKEPATVWPPMMRLSRIGDSALAEEVGRALGAELRAMDFDVDFAPVLDVHTNPQNPIIGDRAFGTTPDEVIHLAGAFARGLRAAGIVPCGKHFPGHGDTSTDSHLHLPRIDHDMARLEAVELAPFRALGPELPLLMTAHVVFAALDETVPATLSPRVLDGLLRKQMGYTGVIVSDDLEMKAVADHFGLEETLERGLLAGCDVFLLCSREDWQLAAHEILIKAAERSSDARRRVEESAHRVLSLKRKHHAHLADRPPLSILGAGPHAQLRSRLA